MLIVYVLARGRCRPRSELRGHALRAPRRLWQGLDPRVCMCVRAHSHTSLFSRLPLPRSLLPSSWAHYSHRWHLINLPAPPSSPTCRADLRSGVGVTGNRCCLRGTADVHLGTGAAPGGRLQERPGRVLKGATLGSGDGTGRVPWASPPRPRGLSHFAAFLYRIQPEDSRWKECVFKQ